MLRLLYTYHPSQFISEFQEFALGDSENWVTIPHQDLPVFYRNEMILKLGDVVLHSFRDELNVLNLGFAA